MMIRYNLGRILHHKVFLRSWDTVLIRAVINRRLLSAEVIVYGRRVADPFPSGAIPRILQRLRPLPPAIDEVEQEEQLARGRPERRMTNEHVDAVQALQIIHARGLRVAPRMTGYAQEVHGNEDRVDADEGDPEVDLADGLVHHLAEHLREPEVAAGEDAEDGRHAHDHVKVRHHEVSIVKIGIEDRLSQNQAP